MTPSWAPRRTFDAALCALDNVIRFYDTTELSDLAPQPGGHHHPLR
ncbi:hypothetical protein ABZ371_22750 [Streptomyces sp. NPDC005899]